MLDLSNLSASIAGVSVLREINAQIARGSTVAVVGRNGAGKTTLLRTIMGFVPHGAEGRIRLDGKDLSQVSSHDRPRLGIGYGPEDRVLFPTFTVEENLRFPCEVIRISKKEIDRSLEEVLSIVPELKLLLGRSGAVLSGGQAKMAVLGRSLMVGTRLVLLDEPFQGLAPVLAAQYTESLNKTAGGFRGRQQGHQTDVPQAAGFIESVGFQHRAVGEDGEHRAVDQVPIAGQGQR